MPGPLSIFERTFKTITASLAGEPAFPVGIIGGGVVFAIEQALIDLDIASCQCQLSQGIGGSDFEESLDLIRQKGIGGLHLDTEHTVLHYRSRLVMPKLFTRLKSTDVANAMAHDPVECAHQRCREILERTNPYTIDQTRRKAIDDVVARATRELAPISGAIA